MNDFATNILKKLENSIALSEQNSRKFVKNPDTDFTRKRKLHYAEMIRLILSMGGQSLKLELLDYFSYDTDTVSCSAFVQQREKLEPELFENLFHDFNSKLPSAFLYEGYRLLAADGSDLNIAYNPNDPDTFQNNGSNKGFNLLHLNALYDLCSKTYVDALIQPRIRSGECKALIEMIERSQIEGKTIVIADRGYESYNVFEHIAKKGWHYLVRVKDITSNGIASSLNLSCDDTFDLDYSFFMTRRQTNEIKANPDRYKFMPKNQVFDFLPFDSKAMYPYHFRILRFPIGENSYEVIMTNLDRETFPLSKIRNLYHMRWGIETSFRELKYAIGLQHFHAKKVAYILQEAFAKLIMYNFCAVITTHILIEQKERNLLYQVNFTIAIAICMRFFKCRDGTPPDVEALIAKNILPVRPGRKDPRKVKIRTSVSFLYRVA